MSLKIEINIPDYDIHGEKVHKSSLLSEDMAALGFHRGLTLPTAADGAPGQPAFIVGPDAAERFARHRAGVLGAVAGEGAGLGAEASTESDGAAAQNEPAAPVEETPKRRRGRPSKTEQEGEPKPNISAGEERIDPAEGASDSEEDAAQDKADEAAEVARERKQPVTVDDIKALAVQYKDQFGMEAVQTDGAKIFEVALGAPPADAAGWRFAILPEEREKLQLAFAAWSEALAKNPFKRERVS